jgi:Tol biopolymer transport system component
VIKVDALSTVGDDSGPVWSSDGSKVYLTNNTVSGYLLYVSNFDGINFSPPTVIPELQTVQALGAALSPDQLELYFNNGTVPIRISRARRPTVTSPWVVEGVVADLVGSGVDDGYASLSPDGLTIYFESDRGGAIEIYSATRPDLGSPFGTAAAFASADLGTLTTGDPDISFDGATFVFDAVVTPGMYDDLYMIQRACP